MNILICNVGSTSLKYQLFDMDHQEHVLAAGGAERVGAAKSVFYHKSSINGSFTADENGWLLIQIPFDEGFTAMVNGEPADISRALGTFMAVPVSAGENTVSLCYFPSGMKLAIILFAIGCAAAVCLRFSKKFGAEFIKVTTILQKAFSIFFFATASFILLFFYLAVFFI